MPDEAIASSPRDTTVTATRTVSAEPADVPPRAASLGDRTMFRIRPRGSRQAAVVLQIFIITAFVCPTDTVIKVIGAAGFVAWLIAMLLLGAWSATALFGFHDPLHNRHPTRGVLAVMVISALLSYIAMPLYAPTAVEQLGALRWLMLWAGMAGVVLTTAEHLRTPQDIVRVVRALVWGAAFSSTVAVLQFFFKWDPVPLLRSALVGFHQNSGADAFVGRGALTRVTGTANHPIEMGVVAGMVLPLAFWLLLYDRERSLRRRILPLVLIAFCIPMSVSRSAVLAVFVALGVFAVLLPASKRVVVLAAVPLGVVSVFMITPGYLRTIYAFATAGKSDASITNRLDNYPRVVALVEDAPWFGRGGGTYIQTDLTKVLDNQYLHSAIELGLVGLVALCLFFLVPPLSALICRARSAEPEFRALCAALAGAGFAAAAAAYTFDALSFPQFTCVEALVVGLSGSCWLYARRSARTPSHDATLTRPSFAPVGTVDHLDSLWFRGK